MEYLTVILDFPTMKQDKLSLIWEPIKVFEF